MKQLGLFAPAPETEAELLFHCHTPVDRSGMAAYTVLIRAPGDPERSPRPVGGQPDRFPHRTIAKSKRDWKAAIRELMADDLPRTFNAMGVQLLDKTADILFGGPVERALWELVDEGWLSHTMTAPVWFRRAAAH